MATFVIVHGGWGGGWEWREVADLLTEHGHVVLTPTLTGLGERSHLLSRSIGLATHVSDVTDLVEEHRLRDVVLVGHSYAGMVITVAAPKISTRLKAVVYVDAFLPEDGECELDLIDPAWVDELILGPARSVGDGWLVPFPFVDDLADLPPEIADRYRGAMHPLATFTDPAHIEGGPTVPTAFVRCTRKDPTDDVFADSVRRARERGWPIRDIDSGHDVQLEDPNGIARLLDELATRMR